MGSCWESHGRKEELTAAHQASCFARQERSTGGKYNQREGKERQKGSKERGRERESGHERGRMGEEQPRGGQAKHLY